MSDTPAHDFRLRSVAAALVVSLFSCGCGLAPTDSRNWLADFDQLEAHLAAAWANLDECAARDHLDLPALDRETRAKIASASTDRAARQAIEEFLATFRDPHLHIDDRASSSDDAGGNQTPSTPRDPGDVIDTALDELGFEECGFRLGEAFDDIGDLGAFTALENDHAFPAGVLHRKAGDDTATADVLGILRIPDFRPTKYRDAAAAAYPAYRSAHPGAWDDETSWMFEDAVANELLRRLASRVRELEARGATRLLVDVTRNGGGSGWCDPAARVLTPVALSPPRVAFIRHPHWSSWFEREIENVERSLARHDLSNTAREYLTAERTRLARCLAESKAVPDRSRIWKEGAGSAPALLYQGDAIVRTPGSLEIERELGSPQFEYEAGVWTRSGALFVAIDDYTASASEYFVAMLRDADAATLVGSRTLGAGQGYTQGGVPCRLTNSGLVIRLSDSARLRKDGTPELSGIEPDRACAGNASALVDATR